MERLRTAFRGRTPVPRAAVGRPEVAAADLVMTFAPPNDRPGVSSVCAWSLPRFGRTASGQPTPAASNGLPPKSVIAIGLWSTTETPSALAAFKGAVAARHGNDAHIRPYLVKGAR
jgi:hypothetical protein